MIHEIWWSLPLTLAVYFAARWLARKLNMPLLNPLLVSMAVIIPLLLLTGIPYERYFQGSKILNDLLQPAVVALAFPLYEQLHQIRARWKSIIAVCFIGSLTAMISGGAIAPVAGRHAGNRRLYPAEIGHYADRHGRRGLARRHSGDQRGLRHFRRYPRRRVRPYAVQPVENHHPLGARSGDGYRIPRAGTARCAEMDYQEGAFGSLALVICGIITSLLAPFLFPVLLHLFG